MKFQPVFLFLIISIFSCSNSTEVNSSTQADDKSEVLNKVLEETVIEHNVPGAVLLVKFDDGSIWKEAYGYANISNENLTNMETSKQFRIGSVTKTFIGSAILILVKQGKLSLSDTVENLLPGILSHGSEITLEMLLNQTSAIPNYTTFDSFVDIYFYSPNYNWSHDTITNLFKDEDLLDLPGNKSYYSNSNYYLLGIIIEKYSGKSLASFLDEEIFSKLEMTNSYFPVSDDLNGNFCHGYMDVNEDGIFTVDEDYSSQNPNAIWAAGGIVSTVDDLLIWSNELLSGSLLNSELQSKRMTIDAPIAEAPEGVNYGLGIADIFGAIGHTGAVSGYSTILFKYKNTTFIAFGNGYETEGKRSLIAEDIFEKAKKALFD